MSFTNQIKSIEELERSVLLYETKLFNRLQLVAISETEKSGNYWESFVGKEIDPRTLESPKEVDEKWQEIRQDRKAAWLDKFTTYHSEKSELFSKGNNNRIF